MALQFGGRPFWVPEWIMRLRAGEYLSSEIDSGPIQRVFDNSRLGTLGARGENTFGMGFLYLNQVATNASGGAFTVRTSTDIYAAFQSISAKSDFQEKVHRLWLIDLFATTEDTNASNLTDAHIELTFTDTTPPRVYLAGRWDSSIGPAVSGGLNPLTLTAAGNQINPPDTKSSWPVFLPLGTQLNSRVKSSGNNVSRIHFLLWAGVLGATPPGMM